MMKFRVGIGGAWLVTQNLGDLEVVNSCSTIDNARGRAEDLASQSPDRKVTIYQAVEIAEATVEPVRFKSLT